MQPHARTIPSNATCLLTGFHPVLAEVMITWMPNARCYLTLQWSRGKLRGRDVGIWASIGAD